LKLQGGPMPAGEVAGFEAEPGYREAIVVRRCDDRGKVAGLATRRRED
jgi:[1-hydroxy-2-(trimethylamino)ethyl]phosphonate dioxygenase